MTSVTERVPLDRIEQRARAARPGRTLAMMIVTVLFRCGWLAAKMLCLLWVAVAWSAVAVAEGWAEGRPPAWAQHVAVRQEAQRRARERRPGPR